MSSPREKQMSSRISSNPSKRLKLVGFAATLMGTAAFVPCTAMAAPLPNCAGLAAQLLKNSDIPSATSAIQPATGSDLSYCLVNITVSDLAGPAYGYLPGQRQMIDVAIGLPLSTADGGSGGTQGNWNGRIQDLGGGGYAGSVGSVTSATDTAYVGSSTDTGHEDPTGAGSFALNPNNTLNWGLINDFAFNGIHEQSVWTKKLTKMYYGMDPKFTYWNGCSTGGRQGHQQAQKYPDDFDGILAGSNAFNWDRFIPTELWGQVVMNREVGAPILPGKLDAVTQAVVAACDSLDGIADGIIQDPRACVQDARAYVCGEPGAASLGSNCLMPQEADSVNKLWDGPAFGHASYTAGLAGNAPDQRLWFGLERGSALAGPTFLIGSFVFADGLDGPTPFFIAPQWFQYWLFQNPAFDWHTLTESTFGAAFLESELKFHQVLGTDDPDLSAFRGHGGKMITYHGLADQLIFPRGTYNYYNRVTQLQGGIPEVQKFYRFFPFPGNAHCGGTPVLYDGSSVQSNAPLINSNDMFNALVNWVENGVAPDYIVAYNTTGGSRPVCKYPDKLIYNGTGNVFSATSFTCQKETKDPLMSAESALPDPGPAGGRGYGH